MRTAAYKVGVASDRRRRKNVPRHILCSISGEKFSDIQNNPFRVLSAFLNQKGMINMGGGPEVGSLTARRTPPKVKLVIGVKS